MGCVLSNPAQTNAARRVRQPIEFYDEEKQAPPPPPLETIDQLRIDCTNILQGLSQIHAPDWINPVVCLNDKAYPLFLASYKFEDRADHIDLPIIAFSRIQNGRFIFIGNLDFVSHPVLQHTETSAFVENMITWGADYKIQTIRITLLGFPPQLISTLQSDFSSYGYIVDSPKEVPATIMSSLVFIASDFVCENLEPIITDYVQRGGTVVVFAVQPEEGIQPDFFMNSQLEQSGLAFAKCSLKPANKIISSSDPTSLDKFTFESTLETYFNILHEAETVEDVDVNLLDQAISQMRFYIGAMGVLNYDDALNITNESLQFLKKIGFQVDEGICPDVVHSLVSVVISELVPKLEPSKIEPAPLIELFPGNTGESVRLTKIKLRIGMKSDSWNSTGLWLPAGTLGSITTDYPVTLQVGSHSLCLLVKPGPWKRWPIVVTRFIIEPNVPTEIASPFGGIIYFISDRNRTIHAVFSNVARYPYYVAQKQTIWDATKDIEVPWGEIQMKTLCVTMPTEAMKRIANLEEYCKLIDKLVIDAFSFVGAKPPDSRRVVFDVDLPQSTPVNSDALVIHIDSVDGIINIQQANSDILLLLSHLTVSSLNNAFYDIEIENTISTLAGCYAIKKAWPDEPPLVAVPGSPSRLFYDLFDLCNEKGHSPFAMAIQAVISSNVITNAKDAWQYFVNKLGRLCNMELPHLIDRFRQTGKLASESPEKLNVYQLEDCDI
ncbi:hypothetical protein TRFO_03881 [Tritrichomonas foetus]|uniref:Peptidase M60 domain-containing protein n=1 Tax=Tritrichomonas foetus TaxID=1144522 RepID=A0A1J4KPM9_9EUKA|nr:hypothetical protein TRFO_03881 [Tritrichomonas foetus]|eukprot:OHT11662.1 hypothetical protein TRFO_03881 [Tritrichomonas foetus]